jgi:hypothetical protein
MNNAGGRSGVNFDQGVRVHITAIDGTWRRACLMSEVSQTGAKLTVDEGIDKLDLREFVLLLTPTGLVSRRCELVSADGDELQIRFVAGDRKKSR